MTVKKLCPSCAAEYDDSLPKCPYCGTLNLKGAKAEYYKKLEDVRADLEDLEDVPVQETKKELKKQMSLVRRILLAVGAMGLAFAAWMVFMEHDTGVDAKAEYRWKQEVFPVLNRLYDEQKFEELVEIYWKYAEDDMPLWDWEHADFCERLDQCLYLEGILDREQAGEALRDLDYVYLLYYGLELNMERNMEPDYANRTTTEWTVGELSAEEFENLAPYWTEIRSDFMVRWDFTEEELDVISKERAEHYGIVSFKFCEEYVEEWLKENK